MEVPEDMRHLSVAVLLGRLVEAARLDGKAELTGKSRDSFRHEIRNCKAALKAKFVPKKEGAHDNH